jgi:hypothetical protein
MIDFKNLKIVKKYSYEGHEYFLRERSEADFNRVREVAGDDGEKLMLDMWNLMLCDSDGELTPMTTEDIREIPSGFRMDIIKSIQELATGQKKS